MQKIIRKAFIFPFASGILLAAALTGCLGEPTIAPVPTATSVELVTATPPAPAPMPSTPTPTEVPREFVGYSHPSGVFTIAIPSDWEVRDSSSSDRLLVSFEPPMGYASRVAVDIVNEGPLTPDEMRAMADSYLRLRFGDDLRYTEVSRTDLPDGRLQVTFLYSDGHGATGRETVYLQQTGAYFSALRVFLSDKDVLHLTSALTTITDSFTIDPLAVWGGALAIVSPGDLRFFRVYSWTDSGGNTYVMGEVYNASATDAAYVTVDAALCEANGVAFETASNMVALDVLERGGFAPFVVLFQDVPEGAVPCDTQARAEPADHEPYTALTLTQTGTFDDFGRLTVAGTVTNNGLEIVEQIEILITAYDAEDDVIGYGVASLDDVQLIPGESAPFEYVFEELGGQAVNLGLWVQAEIVEVGG
jgi:hypothetical protein